LASNDALLTVEGLKTHFYTEKGVVHAVDGVGFTILKAEVMGLVGESGCGKTITALSLMKLVPRPGRIVSGKVKLGATDVLTLDDVQMSKQIRGKEIAMIFQEPMTSLNPVFTIGNQIMEAVLIHQNVDKAKAKQMVLDILKEVRIADPEKVMKQYPHELSGGMQQRAMIAMALVLRPKLLIADEPTTSLDVTIQAQILNLMDILRNEIDSAILLITHNLGIVAWLCDNACVMYAGVIVEQAPIGALYKKPLHPYTRGLIRLVPRLDQRKEWFETIRGRVPDLVNPKVGCRFADRCDEAMPRCSKENPPYYEAEKGHIVKCFLFDGRGKVVRQASEGETVEQLGKAKGKRASRLRRKQPVPQAPAAAQEGN